VVSLVLQAITIAMRARVVKKTAPFNRAVSSGAHGRRWQKALRCNHFHRSDLPVGLSRKNLSSPFGKNIPISFFQK
jgi:hypothetical protein